MPKISRAATGKESLKPLDVNSKPFQPSLVSGLREIDRIIRLGIRPCGLDSLGQFFRQGYDAPASGFGWRLLADQNREPFFAVIEQGPMPELK